MPADVRPLPFALNAAGMSPGASSSLRELTTGLAHGDDAAWVQFHREHGPGIFRHLLAVTRGNHDLASEALQQAYLRIARHARPCDEAPVFAAWLRVVARSALNDCFRRRRSFRDMLRRHGTEVTEIDETGESADEARVATALDAS